MINLTTFAPIVKSHLSMGLRWTTNDIGISGYRIYRNGSPTSTIIDPTASSYIDTGLSPDMTYSFRVDSYNFSGNVISQSNTIIATTHLWSTTYDCADWKTSDGFDIGCDGLKKSGDIKCQPGNVEEQITAAANNPNGGGGKGQRHWLGDGHNILSGGTQLLFTTPQSEIWVRWYTKYPLGFTWEGGRPSGSKLLYFHSDSTPLNTIAPYVMFQYNWMSIIFNPRNDHSADGTGWTHIMGGDKGDGLWHLYEVHLKKDTNGNNGVAEMWVDEVKILSVSDLSYGNATGITQFSIGNNASYPLNGQCTPVDYDDIAISTTGYIGPLDSGSVPPTCPPVVCDLQLTII